MKNIFRLLICFIVFGSHAQSIVLDPRTTSQANLLTKSDFALQKTTSISTTTTHTLLNRDNASILKINGGTIRSISDGSSGLVLYIINTGTAPLTLANEYNSAASPTTPANRIISPTEFDYIVSPNGGAVTLIYDGSGTPTPVNRWKILKRQAEPWNVFGQNSTNSTNFLGTTAAQPLIFKTNNTSRISIGSNGNVGLGTTTPSSKLHVFKGNAGVTLPSNTSVLFEDDAPSGHKISLNAPESSFIRLKFEKPSGLVTGFTLSGSNNFSIYHNDNYSFFSRPDGELEIGEVNRALRNIKFEQPVAYSFVEDPTCIDISPLGCYPINLVNASVLEEKYDNFDITIFGLLPIDVDKASILHIYSEGSNGRSLTIKDAWPFFGAPYKIYTGAGGDLVINGNGGVTLIFNPHKSAWYVVDYKQ